LSGIRFGQAEGAFQGSPCFASALGAVKISRWLIGRIAAQDV